MNHHLGIAWRVNVLSCAGLLISLLGLSGCHHDDAFKSPVSATTLTGLGDAATVKVFVFGDIEAQVPSSINFKNATVTVSNPDTSSIFNTEQSQRPVLENQYYRAKADGTIPDSESQATYEWTELLKNPDEYLDVQSTEERHVSDTYTFDGSGVVLSPDGLIATNAHVVSDGDVQAVEPVIPMLTALRQWCDTNIGPLPDDPDLQKAVDQKLAAWLVSQSQQKFVFREAYVYLNDHSDTLDEQLKVANSNPDSAAMDTLVRSISVEATVLQKGEPWPGDDVAILKVQASHLIALPLADESSIQTGESITTFGYPGAAIMQGMNAEDSYKVVSKTGTIGQTMAMNSGFSAYNISADINHGNSGGPVLNSNGQIIGLGTAGNPSDNGENYAVPVSLIKKYLDKANAVPSLGPESQSWFEGLTSLDKHNLSEAKRDFEAITSTQGAVAGESVLPGTVNRYVAEKLYSLRGTSS